jgi:hypothetical protein
MRGNIERKFSLLEAVEFLNEQEHLSLGHEYLFRERT